MNSLVADYGSESDSDSSIRNCDQLQYQEEKEIENKKSADENKLPPPRFKETGIINESVFRNPYLEAERAKSAILEKHVKMVPSKDNLKTVNGKNICWMNKKGRCRFGNKCKYAHDSELVNNLNVVENTTNDTPTSQMSSKKRKKPGLTQGLIPGKKVLKMFKKTENQFQRQT
ncbi:uncharacterized protein LOC126838559 [Adelges cooleyi]|uniref:uncharacterized protein LOC126838559 n=1 Tax=Adelges cooleyi TaxID=133065 RepID=UPI00217FE8AA|nr:uncharacterized protein LOC126838559 [Adelges cooleyi]